MLTYERLRFFWLALYAQPALWVGLAIFAIVRLESPIWLFLISELFKSMFLSPSVDDVVSSHSPDLNGDEHDGVLEM